MTRRRGRLIALLFLASLWLGALVPPVDAQVTTIETVPPEVDDEGRTASERVDGVVVMLRILGVVVVVSTAAFWWRTRPLTTGKEVEDEPAEVAR